MFYFRAVRPEEAVRESAKKSPVSVILCLIEKMPVRTMEDLSRKCLARAPCRDKTNLKT